MLPLPETILPHRPPFLFLDVVLEQDDDHAVALRTFRADEPFFAGHFPGAPVVPGVLLIEAMAQTLAYLALRRKPGIQVLLTGVESCRIRRAVKPGETVRFEVKVERILMGVVIGTGRATVDGERTAEATLKGYLSEP